MMRTLYVKAFNFYIWTKLNLISFIFKVLNFCSNSCWALTRHRLGTLAGKLLSMLSFSFTENRSEVISISSSTWLILFSLFSLLLLVAFTHFPKKMGNIFCTLITWRTSGRLVHIRWHSNAHIHSISRLSSLVSS